MIFLFLETISGGVLFEMLSHDRFQVKFDI